jgi:hypothetical protein
MDKDFYIECGCGYQMYFTDKEIGATQSCFNCGFSLKVDSPNTTSDNNPTANIEVKTKSSQPKTYSSPFEDDEEPDTPVLPISSTFQPKAMAEPDTANDDRTVYSNAASAFGDLDEEEEDVEEAASSNQPDPSLIREYEGPEHSNRYRQVDETEKCPRCGNPFRGDWDKQSINGHEICYICSNQATKGMPERADTNKFNAAGVDYLEEGQKQIAGLEHDIKVEGTHAGGVEKFWLFDPESDQFRVMLYVLALSTIMITLYAVFFMDSGSSNPGDYSTVAYQAEVSGEASQPLPVWGKVLLVGWTIIEYFTTFVVTVFLILYLSERMPHDHFGMDIFTTILALSPFFISKILMSLVVYFIGSDPSAVTAMAAMIALLRIGGIVLTIMTLMNLLDFRIRDFFYMIIVDGIVGHIMSLIGALVYAGIAQVAL